MHVDFRTLLFADTLVTAFCAAARLLLWRLHPSVPGLSLWAWANVVGVVAFVLLITDQFVSQRLLLSLSEGLIVSGLVLSWEGYRRFGGRSTLPARTVACIAALAAVPILLVDIEGWRGVRSTINASLVTLITGLIAHDLFRNATRDQTTLRMAAWLYAVNAGFFLLRLMVAVPTIRADPPAASDRFNVIAAFWWLGMVLAITLSMILMTGERLQRDLLEQASRDPLTGALNRRAFAMLAKKEVARARRTRSPLSLLILDFDHFKQINDRLGHPGGDAMLCLFVDVAERTLRDEDVLCRFGGEEFVALLPGSDAGQAVAAAERLRTQLSESAKTALADVATALPFDVTISVGVGELQPGEGFEETIRRADAALYRAKAAGRNRVERAESGNAVR